MDYWCRNNQLTSLKGVPNKIGGEFWYDSEKISAKEKVSYYFNKYIGRFFKKK